jgi:uncharacterized protein (UPF0333 family)
MKKRGSFKAQVSMEFLLVVGFAFLMTVPLIVIFYQQSQSINTEVSATQIDKVGSEVRDAADEVYYLGSPSKKSISIFMPEGVKGVSFINNDDGASINFNVSSPSGNYEVVKWVASKTLSGNIGNFEGIHCIVTQACKTILGESYIAIIDNCSSNYPDPCS